MSKKSKKKKSKLKLFSDIHHDTSSLWASLVKTKEHRDDAEQRRELVRDFTNMRNILSDEEVEEQGEEIINFGNTFEAASANIAPLEALVIGTRQLAKVKVDSDDLPRDSDLGTEITNLANDWLFTGVEKFHSLWRTIIGEGHISGGGFGTYDSDDAGLYPEYSTDLYFPEGSSLDPSDMTYCFKRSSMTINALKELRRAITDEKDQTRKQIEKLIEGIESSLQTRGSTAENTTFGSNSYNKSVREEDCSGLDAEVEVWKYFEVRINDEGDKYVSLIIFADGSKYDTKSGSKDNDVDQSNVSVIAQIDKAFNDLDLWLMAFVFDEEIGGTKTVDTLRGMAEAYYRSGVMIERLQNAEIEGAIQRSMVTLVPEEGANIDEILDFQLGEDLFAPSNVGVLELPNNSGSLRSASNALSQNVAGIASSSVSNNGRGQELRQQALERQEISFLIRNNRNIKALNKIATMVTIIIHRALYIEPTKGTEDYQKIKGFQEEVDRAIIRIYKLDDDVENDGVDEDEDEKSAKGQAKKIRRRLAKRRFGRMRHIRVTVSESGLPDRATNMENADFVLRMIETGRVTPELVPQLLDMVANIFTGSTDIADALSANPEPIRADETYKARVEWETITRRSAAGLTLPTNQKDVDDIHVEEHITDFVAMVNMNVVRPWDKLDVLKVTGATDHIAEHIQKMLGKPESRGAAAQYQEELKQLVSQAIVISQELEDRRIAEGDPNKSPEDRLIEARTALTYAQIEDLAVKRGIKIADVEDIMRNRRVRADQNDDRLAITRRQALASEVNADRTFLAKKDERTNQGQSGTDS